MTRRNVAIWVVLCQRVYVGSASVRAEGLHAVKNQEESKDFEDVFDIASISWRLGRSTFCSRTCD